MTAEHEARERRATAAALAAELGAADELTDVVAAAVAGLSVLFGGEATVSVVVGRTSRSSPHPVRSPPVTSTRGSRTGSTRTTTRTPAATQALTSTASCSRPVAAHPGAGSGSRSRWRAP